MSRKLIFRLFCLLILLGPMVLRPTTKAQAEKIVDRQDISYPLDYINYVPCINNGSGDYLHVIGTFTYHIRYITDPLDPNFSIRVINSNFSNTSAVSITTGMKYQVSATYHTAFLSASDPLIVNSHEITRAVGPGKNNILRIQYDLKLVINKDGEYTVIRSNYAISCENPIFP